MRSLSAGQQALLDATSKTVVWTWIVETTGGTTYTWGMKKPETMVVQDTWDDADHEAWDDTHEAWDDASTTIPGTFKVIPESFAGITLNRANSENGIQSPNTLTFSVTNSGDALTASDFAGATVRLELLLQTATAVNTIARWAFRVLRCEAIYQNLDFTCEDFIQQYLEGDYPKTELIKDLAPSDDSVPNDNLCVPLPFGTCYIPLRSVYVSGDSARYYIIGPTGKTYTITKVRSPVEWPAISEWDSGSFTFTQHAGTKVTGYVTIDPVIADSDADGTADATGLWKQGDGFLDMPCKFSRSDTSTKTSPADVIQFILEDFGVPTIDIDVAGSFATAKTTYTSWGLTWNGALFARESRRAILARLLIACHSTLRITDKVELHALSKTSQKTITNVDVLRESISADQEELSPGEGSFRYSAVVTEQNDAGYYLYQDGTTPQSTYVKLQAKAKATNANPSTESIDLIWVQDIDDGYRLASLYYQRKFLASANASFDSKASLLALQPDDVMTINYADYGGSYAVLIDQIRIARDLVLSFSVTKFSAALDDWADISVPGVTLGADDIGNSYIWQLLVAGPRSNPDSGIAQARFPGDVFIASGNDFVIESGGDFRVESGGDIEIESGGDIEIESGGNVNVQSGGKINVKSGGDIEIESGGDILIESGGDITVASGGATILSSGGDIKIYDGGDLLFYSDAGSTLIGTLENTGGYLQIETDLLRIGEASSAQSWYISVDVGTDANALLLYSSNADAAAGPRLLLARDSATPADNDWIGSIEFYGDDSGAAQQGYVLVYAQVIDVTATTEDSALWMQCMQDGVYRNLIWERGGLYFEASNDPGVGSIANHAGFFATGLTPTNIYAMDENGNDTLLSPHGFELFQPKLNEPYPFSYFSYNKALGKKVEVDMMGMAREVELLSGKQLVYYEDIPIELDVFEKRKKYFREKWIKENMIKEIIPDNEAFEERDVEENNTNLPPISWKNRGWAMKNDKKIEQRVAVYQKRMTKKIVRKLGVNLDEKTGEFFKLKFPKSNQIQQALTDKYDNKLEDHFAAWFIARMPDMTLSGKNIRALKTAALARLGIMQ